MFYYHNDEQKNDSDGQIVKDIRDSRRNHGELGAKKLAKLLSNDHRRINHKRMARILRENDLTIKRKKKPSKRCDEIERLPLPNVEERNDLWSIDFMCSRKNNSFKFCILNAVDVESKQAPLMSVERSFTGLDVTQKLDIAIKKYGRPKGIVSDNGTEFTSSCFRLWCEKNGITHYLINKGSPSENCYVESFNSSVRREVLDPNDFNCLDELRLRIDNWKDFYNKYRPHGSLEYLSPESYIKLTKNQEIAV